MWSLHANPALVPHLHLEAPEKGEQTGEWTTYDRKGKVYKVTLIKPKSKK